MSPDEVVPGFDPDHWYYSPLGEPITLEEWGKAMSGDRTLRQDEINGLVLKTVYLGFVCPHIYDARLFGSALFAPDNGFVAQIQVYDSEQDAILGHFAHADARHQGFHCHLCKNGKIHQD